MAKARETEQTPGWHFFRRDWRLQANDKKVDTGLNLELGGLVREATQNSNDAKLDGATSPAKIHYRLLLLSGAAKEKFISAGQLQEIGERIKAGTENPNLNYSNSGLRARLNTSNERLRALASSVLPVLVITDSGTKGLKGKDDDEGSSFHTFTHTIGRSQDRGNGSGGSHGVGKGLLWELSAYRTIFIATVDSDHPERGTRFYGVANNVAHDYRGATYSGVGFFGAPDVESDEHALSIYSPHQQLLDDLFLDTPKPSGLSICIPGLIPDGFEDQLWAKAISSKSAAGATEVAEEIRDSLIKSFWPALSWKRFEARITCESIGSEERILFDEMLDRRVLDSRPELKRLSQAFDPNSNAASESDPEKGISSHVIEVTVPKGHVSSTNQQSEADAQAILVLAHLNDTEIRSVEAIRGTGMVIDSSYESFSQYQEGPGWAGMLLAGRAAERHKTIGNKISSDAAKTFDTFLTYCEGATHVKWNPSEQAAVAVYKKTPTQATLKNLRSRVREEIRISLQGLDEERDEFPAWFDLAPITGPKRPGPQRFYMRASDRVNQGNSIGLTAHFELGKKKSTKLLRLRAKLLNDKNPTNISLKNIVDVEHRRDLNALTPASGALTLKLELSGLQVNADRAGIQVWLERERDEDTSE